MPEEENDDDYIDNNNDYYVENNVNYEEKNDNKYNLTHQLPQTYSQINNNKELTEFDDFFDINNNAKIEIYKPDNKIIYISNIKDPEYENQLIKKYEYFYTLDYNNDENRKKLLEFVESANNDDNISKIPLKEGISFDDFINANISKYEPDWTIQTGKDAFRGKRYLNDKRFKEDLCYIKYPNTKDNSNMTDEEKYKYFEEILIDEINKTNLYKKYSNKINDFIRYISILLHQTVLSFPSIYFFKIINDPLNIFIGINDNFYKLDVNNFIIIENDKLEFHSIYFAFLNEMENENKYNKKFGHALVHFHFDILNKKAFINVLSFKYNYELLTNNNQNQYKNNVYQNEINNSSGVKNFLKENPKTSVASSLVALGMLSVIPYTLITLLGGKTIKKRRKYINKFKSRKIQKINKNKNKYLKKFKTRKNKKIQKNNKNKYLYKIKSKKYKK